MHKLDKQRRWLARGIATLGGYVDATGFLAGGGYFVSFMSGNTTRLGVDFATRGTAALTPALLILEFVVGVALGAVAAEKAGERRKTAVLALSCTLLSAAAVAHQLSGTRMFLTASVLAMGAINNTFRRNGEVAVGVTYMTGALVRAGQALAGWLMRKRLEGGWASLGLWAFLAIGAVAGAATTKAAPGLSPWIAVLASASLLAWASIVERDGRLS